LGRGFQENHGRPYGGASLNNSSERKFQAVAASQIKAFKYSQGVKYLQM